MTIPSKTAPRKTVHTASVEASKRTLASSLSDLSTGGTLSAGSISRCERWSAFQAPVLGFPVEIAMPLFFFLTADATRPCA